MRLTAYGCPKCGYVADHIGAARTRDGALQIKCPVCRHVESLRPGAAADPEVVDL